MQILYDHQVFSLQDAGGAARYHYELISHMLPRFDVRIELMLGMHNSIYPFANLESVGLRVTGKVTSLRPGAKRYVFNEALLSPISAARKAVDIYHPTFYRSMPFVRRRRMVATHHDSTHEIYPHMFHNASLVVRNKRKLYASADAIICVSESSRRDLLRFFDVDPSHAFVVYHGFRPLAYSKDIDTNSTLTNRPYLLFVGFRETYKNFNSLLFSYARSGVARDYDLVAVGGGEFRPQELSNISKLGIVGKVKSLQRVSDKSLASLYRGAALFVYPSLYEGFGFPPLEAMSMGCPVLASSTSSIPEVCGDAAFYFDPADDEDLQRSLVGILNIGDSLSAMRARGYAQIAKFDWNETADNTYRVYQSLLA